MPDSHLKQQADELLASIVDVVQPAEQPKRSKGPSVKPSPFQSRLEKSLGASEPPKTGEKPVEMGLVSPNPPSPTPAQYSTVFGEGKGGSKSLEYSTKAIPQGQPGGGGQYEYEEPAPAPASPAAPAPAPVPAKPTLTPPKVKPSQYFSKPLTQEPVAKSPPSQTAQPKPSKPEAVKVPDEDMSVEMEVGALLHDVGGDYDSAMQVAHNIAEQYGADEETAEPKKSSLKTKWTKVAQQLEQEKKQKQPAAKPEELPGEEPEAAGEEEPVLEEESEEETKAPKAIDPEAVKSAVNSWLDKYPLDKAIKLHAQQYKHDLAEEDPLAIAVQSALLAKKAEPKKEKPQKAEALPELSQEGRALADKKAKELLDKYAGNVDKALSEIEDKPGLTLWKHVAQILKAKKQEPEPPSAADLPPPTPPEAPAPKPKLKKPRSLSDAKALVSNLLKEGAGIDQLEDLTEALTELSWDDLIALKKDLNLLQSKAAKTKFAQKMGKEILGKHKDEVARRLGVQKLLERAKETTTPVDDKPVYDPAKQAESMARFYGLDDAIKVAAGELKEVKAEGDQTLIDHYTEILAHLAAKKASQPTSLTAPSSKEEPQPYQTPEEADDAAPVEALEAPPFLGEMPPEEKANQILDDVHGGDIDKAVAYVEKWLKIKSKGKLPGNYEVMYWSDVLGELNKIKNEQEEQGVKAEDEEAPEISEPTENANQIYGMAPDEKAQEYLNLGYSPEDAVKAAEDLVTWAKAQGTNIHASVAPYWQEVAKILKAKAPGKKTQAQPPEEKAKPKPIEVGDTVHPKGELHLLGHTGSTIFADAGDALEVTNIWSGGKYVEVKNPKTGKTSTQLPNSFKEFAQPTPQEKAEQLLAKFAKNGESPQDALDLAKSNAKLYQSGKIESSTRKEKAQYWLDVADAIEEKIAQDLNDDDEIVVIEPDEEGSDPFEVDEPYVPPTQDQIKAKAQELVEKFSWEGLDHAKQSAKQAKEVDGDKWTYDFWTAVANSLEAQMMDVAKGKAEEWVGLEEYKEDPVVAIDNAVGWMLPTDADYKFWKAVQQEVRNLVEEKVLDVVDTQYGWTPAVLGRKLSEGQYTKAGVLAPLLALLKPLSQSAIEAVFESCQNDYEKKQKAKKPQATSAATTQTTFLTPAEPKKKTLPAAAKKVLDWIAGKIASGSPPSDLTGSVLIEGALGKELADLWFDKADIGHYAFLALFDFFGVEPSEDDLDADQKAIVGVLEDMEGYGYDLSNLTVGMVEQYKGVKKHEKDVGFSLTQVLYNYLVSSSFVLEDAIDDAKAAEDASTGAEKAFYTKVRDDLEEFLKQVKNGAVVEVENPQKEGEMHRLKAKSTAKPSKTAPKQALPAAQITPEPAQAPSEKTSPDDLTTADLLKKWLKEQVESRANEDSVKPTLVGKLGQLHGSISTDKYLAFLSEMGVPDGESYSDDAKALYKKAKELWGKKTNAKADEITEWLKNAAATTTGGVEDAAKIVLADKLKEWHNDLSNAASAGYPYAAYYDLLKSYGVNEQYSTHKEDAEALWEAAKKKYTSAKPSAGLLPEAQKIVDWINSHAEELKKVDTTDFYNEEEAKALAKQLEGFNPVGTNFEAEYTKILAQFGVEYNPYVGYNVDAKQIIKALQAKQPVAKPQEAIALHPEAQKIVDWINANEEALKAVPDGVSLSASGIAVIDELRDMLQGFYSVYSNLEYEKIFEHFGTTDTTGGYYADVGEIIKALKAKSAKTSAVGQVQVYPPGPLKSATAQGTLNWINQLPTSILTLKAAGPYSYSETEDLLKGELNALYSINYDAYEELTHHLWRDLVNASVSPATAAESIFNKVKSVVESLEAQQAPAPKPLSEEEVKTKVAKAVISTGLADSPASLAAAVKAYPDFKAACLPQVAQEAGVSEAEAEQCIANTISQLKARPKALAKTAKEVQDWIVEKFKATSDPAKLVQYGPGSLHELLTNLYSAHKPGYLMLLKLYYNKESATISGDMKHIVDTLVKWKSEGKAPVEVSWHPQKFTGIGHEAITEKITKHVAAMVTAGKNTPADIAVLAGMLSGLTGKLMPAIKQHMEAGKGPAKTAGGMWGKGKGHAAEALAQILITKASAGKKPVEPYVPKPKPASTPAPTTPAKPAMTLEQVKEYLDKSVLPFTTSVSYTNLAKLVDSLALYGGSTWSISSAAEKLAGDPTVISKGITKQQIVDVLTPLVEAKKAGTPTPAPTPKPAPVPAPAPTPKPPAKKPDVGFAILKAAVDAINAPLTGKDPKATYNAIKALGKDQVHDIPTWQKMYGKVRYGGVVFKVESGTVKILLRAPKDQSGHKQGFEGVLWTARNKGGLEGWAHPIDGALKEVLEESGQIGEVAGIVPGQFEDYQAGGNKWSHDFFFLMHSTGEDLTEMLTDPIETEETRWCTQEEALDLVKTSKNKKYADEDVKLIEAAFDAYGKLQKGEPIVEAPSDLPVVSFDFDGVLHISVKADAKDPHLYHTIDHQDWDGWQPNDIAFTKLKQLAKDHKIVIVTARDEAVKPLLWKYVKKHGLPVSEIYCTSNGPKMPVLDKIGAVAHFDDSPKIAHELMGWGGKFVKVEPFSKDPWPDIYGPSVAITPEEKAEQIASDFPGVMGLYDSTAQVGVKKIWIKLPQGSPAAQEIQSTFSPYWNPSKQHYQDIKIDQAVLAGSILEKHGFYPYPKDPAALTLVKPLGGHSGAKASLVKDDKGRLWVRKKEVKPGELEREVAADKIYALMGAGGLASAVVSGYKLSRYVEGETLARYQAHTTPEKVQQVYDEIKKGFVLDCLLGNYDVVGTSPETGGFDNTVVGLDGKVYRIDNGGVFGFSATGKKAGTTSKSLSWGEQVYEVEKLLNPSTHPQSALVYKGITKTEIASQIGEIESKQSEILALVPDWAKEVVKKRIKWLVLNHGWMAVGMRESPDSIYAGKGKPWPATTPDPLVIYTPPTIEKANIIFRDYKETDVRKKIVEADYAQSFKDFMNGKVSALTSSQKSSIHAYCGSAYDGLNENMRASREDFSKLSAYQKKLRQDISNAIASAGSFSMPIMCWRNTGLYTYQDVGKKFLQVLAWALKKGEPVRIPGFKSFAMGPSVSFGGGDIKIELIAKTGLWIEKISSHGAAEKEILQDHDRYYEVVWIKDASEFPSGCQWGIHPQKIVCLREV